MIEEEVVVTGVDRHGISVARGLAGSCSGCSQSCSSAALGKALQREVVLRLPMQQDYADLRPGDRIVLGISETELLGLSLKVYLLPLAALFAGAVAGAWGAAWFAVQADLAAIGGGLFGLLAGFGMLRRTRTPGGSAAPVILRKLA